MDLVEFSWVVRHLAEWRKKKIDFASRVPPRQPEAQIRIQNTIFDDHEFLLGHHAAVFGDAEAKVCLFVGPGDAGATMAGSECGERTIPMACGASKLNAATAGRHRF